MGRHLVSRVGGAVLLFTIACESTALRPLADAAGTRNAAREAGAATTEETTIDGPSAPGWPDASGTWDQVQGTGGGGGGGGSGQPTRDSARDWLGTDSSGEIDGGRLSTGGAGGAGPGGSGGSFPPLDASIDVEAPDLPALFDAPASGVADASIVDAPGTQDAPRPVWPDAPAVDVSFGEVSDLLKWFCNGNASKLWLNGATYLVPATTKITDPQLSCCTSYAARMHSKETLGDDVELVLRFRGAPSAGSYDLAGSPNVLTARARASKTSPDGGTSAESPVTGVVVIGGTPEDGKQAWPLSVCAYLADPSSPWFGLLIYVPVVTVAPPGWASRFQIFQLADPTLTGGWVLNSDMATVELAPEPLYDLTDIDYVRMADRDMWVGINTAFASGMSLLARDSTSPYVVKVDGERAFTGQVMPERYGGPTWGAWTPERSVVEDGFSMLPGLDPYRPDLRYDPRVVKLLMDAGKAIPGDTH